MRALKTVDTQAKRTDETGAPAKSAKPKTKPFGARLLAPLEWTAKSLAWLISSEKNGGAKFVLYGMSLYCFAVSAETIYVALPISESAKNAGIENLRFLPKPGIPDEANVKHLIPLPTVGNTFKRLANSTVGNLVPFYPKHEITPQWTIWADPSWYIAAAIAGLIGLIEAKAIRRTADSWERKRKKFNSLNERQVPDLNPKAVMAASLARTEMQTDGTGNYAMVAVVILITYGTEFYCFSRSLGGLQITLVTKIIYALINVFGFEFCWALADDPEEEGA